jgi:hypothetical protein
MQAPEAVRLEGIFAAGARRRWGMKLVLLQQPSAGRAHYPAGWS